VTGPEPDEHQVDQPTPELTPAQERAVRDLLAGARHDKPVPPQVVARLDATLAGLVAERGATPAAAPAPSSPASPSSSAAPAARPSAPVVPLARRRRRIASASLVAAAAVVVGGVAIGQMVGGQSGSSDSASISDDSGAGEHSPAEALRDRESPTAAREQPTTEEGELPVPDLGSATLRRHVRALAPVAAADGTLRDRDAPCRVGDAGPGDRVRVTYEGQDGLLVFRAPAGDVQRVDLYLCGSEGVARTVILHGR
jgi:hypothetical protein